MAAWENPGNILETVEERENEVSESASTKGRRVAGTSDSEQSEGILEDSTDVKRGTDK